MLTRFGTAAAIVWFITISLVLIVIAHGAAVMVRSLPVEDGEIHIAGLSAAVTIERDALGIAVISAANLNDAVCAQGFVHAQERFFQMDMVRRRSAGRLSELVGTVALRVDVRTRPYRFDDVADEVLAQLPEAHMQLLTAYTRGVNAGLSALTGAPFEYQALSIANLEGVSPQPWTERDCVLVALSMTMTLASGEYSENVRTALTHALPAELVAFLLPETTRFDAPMIAGVADDAPLQIPPEGVVSFDTNARMAKHSGDDSLAREALGSNNWAVSGARTVHGGAMLANDMHLPLSVPNIWYRAQLEWSDEAGEHRCVGVSLPGTPGIIAGSNGHIAWGFTNAFVDVKDTILIEVDSDDASQYLTPDGPEAFGIYETTIRIAGGAPQTHSWRTTRWGIVTNDTPARVLKWAAFDPAATNLRLFDVWTATTLEEAVAVLGEWRGAAQNVAIASADGRVAWIVAGYLPKRTGFDGRISQSWATGDFSWGDDSLDENRPSLIDPDDGVVWSANNRTVSVSRSVGLLDGYGFGYRAQRIRAMIGTRTNLSERDMLEMQLDTRVEVAEFCRTLAAAGYIYPEDSPVRWAAERIRHWNGRADSDEVGYGVIRDFYFALCDRVLDPLLAPCVINGKPLSWRNLPSNRHDVLVVLLKEQPAHFLSPEYESWENLIVDALTEAGAKNNDARTWGSRNRLRMRHPLALSMPKWMSLFDMHAHEQPGDIFAVRVSDPDFSASQRLVVSPGHEADGILHMPGGQSGNPLSPHYRDGHRAWETGQATPLLAGPPMHTLRLIPFGSP